MVLRSLERGTPPALEQVMTLVAVHEAARRPAALLPSFLSLPYFEWTRIFLIKKARHLFSLMSASFYPFCQRNGNVIYEKNVICHE